MHRLSDREVGGSSTHFTMVIQTSSNGYEEQYIYGALYILSTAASERVRAGWSSHKCSNTPRHVI